jgi:preprotein translocase subunit SecG
MDALVLVIEILLCLFSLFMVAVVLLQSGKSAGLSGDIAGGAESFLGKSKAKGYEGTLKKLTKVSAVGIMVLAVALVFIQVYIMPSGTEPTTPAVEASATPEPLQVPDSTANVDITAAVQTDTDIGR